MLLPMYSISVYWKCFTHTSDRMILSDVIAAWSAPHWNKECSSISLNQSCFPNLIFTFWQMRKLLDWYNCTAMGVAKHHRPFGLIFSCHEVRSNHAVYRYCKLILLLLDYIFCVVELWKLVSSFFMRSFFSGPCTTPPCYSYILATIEK